MKKYKNVIASVSLTLLFFYLSCYHYTRSHEFGLVYNLITGEVKPDGRSGHHLSYPWVLAAKIDARPIRVCIASVSRNLNCRLVKFDTSQYRELIKTEGFRYYWWYNRLSFNSGQETYRGTANLLLGHSYGINRGSFVIILEEIGDDTN